MGGKEKMPDKNKSIKKLSLKGKDQCSISDHAEDVDLCRPKSLKVKQSQYIFNNIMNIKARNYYFCTHSPMPMPIPNRVMISNSFTISEKAKDNKNQILSIPIKYERELIYKYENRLYKMNIVDNSSIDIDGFMNGLLKIWRIKNENDN